LVLRCVWQTPPKPILTVLIFFKKGFCQTWPYKKKKKILLVAYDLILKRISFMKRKKNVF